VTHGPNLPTPNEGWLGCLRTGRKSPKPAAKEPVDSEAKEGAGEVRSEPTPNEGWLGMLA
jgi:hypothetical protein